MQVSLEGAVAIVTGASRGIGKQLVRHFARSGAKVVFCARRAEPLLALEAELKREGLDVLGYAADVASPTGVTELVGAALERYGRVDVLINNVGVSGPTRKIEETELAEWNETLSGNLTSTFLCLRAVVPVMKKQGGGSIVNIGSVTGKRPLPFRIGYAAAKMGVIGLTRTAAEELGPHKIRVNCICPGAVDGERLDEVLAGQAQQRGTTPEQIREAFKSQSPLRALVAAEDVVDMALFLSSDHSRHMTGQDINVTAGLVMY
jgi:NAD(P)-dependent dehydrogenase (short-subunit alcohol dehydrogenase family)